MRRLLLIPFLLTPLLAQAQLKREPTLPIPSYEGYMTLCMDEQKPFRSENETMIGAAACQCYFEQFPVMGNITLDKYKAGMKACQVDADKDPRGFVENYFSRVRGNFNKRYWPNKP
jgi:hypothetical protein